MASYRIAHRVLAGILVAAAPAAAADLVRDASESRPSAIALRKRLHVNPLITEPDTMDFEWGGAFSTGGPFTLPATIRFTPEGRHVYWGRTELSVSFDSLSYDGSATHFGDRTTFAATCVVRDGEKLDFAIAPTVSALLRGDTGARLGATAIARYDVGRSSAGVTVAWSSATHASPTNPSGTLDIGAGYGYRLKPSGPLGHLTAHANWLWEKSTGTVRQMSVFEGVEYQITDPVAVDFSAQHLSLWGGPTDHQIVIGLTVSTGRLHRRETTAGSPTSRSRPPETPHR
jgi:hypothetical protein